METDTQQQSTTDNSSSSGGRDRINSSGNNNVVNNVTQNNNNQNSMWRSTKPSHQLDPNRVISKEQSSENLMSATPTRSDNSISSGSGDSIGDSSSSISSSSELENNQQSQQQQGSNNNSGSNKDVSSSIGNWWSKLKFGNNNSTGNSTNNSNNNSVNNSPTLMSRDESFKDDDQGEVIYHSTPSSKIIKEGILNKQGHVRRNWLPRYFILTDQALEYYKDQGQTLLNAIPLSECTISLADTETKKAFCFKISHSTRKTFYLLSNAQDIQRDSYEWIGAIQEVIDNLSATAAANNPNNGGVVSPNSTVVTESHRSYELVHAISNALLYSLGKTSAATVNDLYLEDFTASEGQSIQRDGVKNTFSYKFVDYSPKVFRKIRELSNVNPADYMISLTRDTLTEIPTPGRSNSLFYFTSDKKYLIKTITSTEFDQLRNILTNYYFHLSQNKDSLIVKFFGLHHISPSKMKNTYFVVMENIFEDKNMDEIYDLKGSTLHRKADTGKSVMMDLDFCTRIFISDDIKAKFFKQIESDCNFLEKNMSMDYSLLLGIHYLNGKKVVSSEDEKQSIFKRENGGMVSRTSNGEFYDRIYYIAIIDVLTTYNIKKQIEHTYKATIYDTKDSMSAVDPQTYSSRFRAFVQKITGWQKKESD